MTSGTAVSDRPVIEPAGAEEHHAVRSARRVSSGGRLLSVQYARGVAAVGVLLFHAFNDASVTGYPEQVLQAGVDLFFVISGFIMWVTTHQSKTGPRQFLGKRVRRIVPLYWLFTALAVLIAVGAPQLGKSTNAEHAIASFFFLPAISPASHLPEPVLAPGWTLNHEMVFYLIFALALTLSSPRRRLAAVAGVNVVLVVLGLLTHGPLVLSFYSNPIILEFVFGVFVGWAYTSGYRLSRPVSGALVLTGTAVMVGCAAAWGQTVMLRVLLWGVPAAVIILALALTENSAPVKRLRSWQLLGDASYSIYIVHGVALSALLSIVNHLGAPRMLMIPVGAPIAIGLGLGVYRYIERPMTDYLRRRRRAPVTVPVPRVTSEVAAGAVDA
jgi:exopolysaccharide production protein ExoZ